MKIFKSSIFVVIITLMIFFEFDVVNAASYNGYIYESEKIDGIYFYKHRSDTDTIKYDTHNFHEQATIYRRSNDGRYVYCIQNWAKLTGAKTGDYEVFSISNNNTSLTNEQLLKIETIGYFGYGYKDSKYDHTDEKWYAITQYLIWKVESPNIETYFVDSITSTTPVNRFTNEIKEILDLVEESEHFPNFGVDIVEHTIYDNIHLTDLDKTLTFPNTTVKTRIQSKVTVSGNDITIKPTIDGQLGGKLIVYREGNRFSDYSKLYVSEKYQNAIAIGNYTRKYNEYPIKDNYANANIEIYCENLNGFNNGFKYINKKCNATNNNALLYAASDIYNNDRELILKKDQALPISSNSKYSNLYPAKYYTKPELELDGYFSPSKDIDLSNALGLTINEKLIYELQKAKIISKKYKEIVDLKKDDINYQFVPGNEFDFGLYANDDIIKTSTSEVLFNKDDLISNITTDAEGNILFDIDIPYGSYYIKEIYNNTSYRTNDTKYYIDFIMEGNERVKSFVVDDIYNYLNRGIITIHIKDEDTNVDLSPIDVSIFDDNNNLIYNAVTDEEGNIIVELPYGKYYVKQTSALEEYIYSTDLIECNLLSDNEYIEINNKKRIIEVSGGATLPEKPNDKDDGSTTIDEGNGFIVDVPSTSYNDYSLSLILLFFIISSLGLLYEKKKK